MKYITTLLSIAALSVCAFAAEGDAGFKPLFNGKDATGWKLRNESGHNAWKVVDGNLTNDLKKGEHGTDLLTEEKFWNFTVRFEYQVPDKSNSGFYLRGRHEIQILGDHESGKVAKGSNGAIYNLKPPAEFASKPGGEWQTVEATIIGNKVSVTLNGKKIHENVQVDAATGGELDGNVKEPGPILLQGDHGAVSFRKIEIKALPKE